ncbi:FAD binding domain protein [Lineolata rhizophorae]|uniref:FAD binding domain protein n=1 Tax=Lineolata rhizophorae TaxID=578093 RepID=A0A6A6NR35_9PEZI|nr:FAD binding domain protein [Lineolata rhizophorae]
MVHCLISPTKLLFPTLKSVQTPSDSCWPPPDAWNALNDTISGRLLHPFPPGSVCYISAPTYDAEACAPLLAGQWFDPTFHAENPLDINHPQWAGNPCPPVWPNGTSVNGDPTAGADGCSRGRYPEYVVNATKPIHVQEAVRFAKQWNLRLNIKSTGHSFQGRSTAPGSFIWTRHIRGIEFHSEWQSEYCPSSSLNASIEFHGEWQSEYGPSSSLNASEYQMAATIAAGETDLSVYEALATHNAFVVGGAEPSVGIVGWFTGGGHGYVSTTYGMGADNVLEATVVLPSGELVTTNACQHPDLFFAIRGGGGGTYGIITSVVMRAYSQPVTTTVTLFITYTAPGNDSTARPKFWELMANLHSLMPDLSDGGLQGYYIIGGPPTFPQLMFQGLFMLFNKPNGTVEVLTAPVVSILNVAMAEGIVQYQTAVETYPTYWQMYEAKSGGQPVATGGTYLGSRLLTKRALTEDLGALAATFEEIGPTIDGVSNPILIGHMIANRDNRNLDIGLNPAWRDAYIHFIVVEVWPDNSSPSYIQSIKDDITFNKTHALRQLSPGSGAYFNEADPAEPDWQYTFFGQNYARLRTVKERYDPEGLLWCYSCVGSEEWVDREDMRLCRVQWANGEDRPQV